MNYIEKFNYWKAYKDLDKEILEELLKIENDENEIKERFSNDLEFGTAGLRGMIAAGSDRMNIYTVRRTTQGLAMFINEDKESNGNGVAIAYDSRHKSKEFAKEAARVLAGNGIKVYLFDELKPTPMLSFAIRHLGCISGIVITASHNPAIYNGYKAYGDDGAQIGPEIANKVISKINSLDFFKDIKIAEENSPLINYIGQEVEDAFLSIVKAQQIIPDAVEKVADSFKVVYTPFHGTGNKPVRKIFDMIGLKNVFLVKEQCEPDGDFPTVKSPNPEEKDGFKLAIDLAKEKDVDLIIGTDPDCDRVGVVVKNSQSEYIVLTGNQTGALLTEYILSQRTALGKMPRAPFVIKTIVTTGIIDAIAKNYDVTMMECLTGFKFIGELIKQHDENGDMSYVFGFEESYGYLPGTYARDKDAVAASMLIAEMAAFYNLNGMTLYDALIKMYEKYGFYYEGVKNIYKKGIDGIKEIQDIMKTIRDNPYLEINGTKVAALRDYKTGVRKDFFSGEETSTDLPSSNVLYFELEDNSWVVLRPSGTEPKLKIYTGVCAKSMEIAKLKSEALINALSID